MSKYFVNGMIVDVPESQVQENQINVLFIPLTQQELDRYEINENPDYVRNGTINGLTLSEISFNNLKESKISTLNFNYMTELNKGFKYTISNVEKTFLLDDNTENNISKQKIDWDLQKTQQDYDENLQFFAITDSTKSQIIFNIEQFLNFSALFGRKIKELKIAYASKRNSVNTAQDETALNSVTITF